MSTVLWVEGGRADELRERQAVWKSRRFHGAGRGSGGGWRGGTLAPRHLGFLSLGTAGVLAQEISLGAFRGCLLSEGEGLLLKLHLVFLPCPLQRSRKSTEWVPSHAFCFLPKAILV